MAAIQQCYSTAIHLGAKAITPLLLTVGIVSLLAGFGATFTMGVTAGLSLFFCGVGAIALARVLELLKAISDDLAVMRDQMSRGMFGLLGMPKP